MKTPEQIAEAAGRFSGRANTAAINRIFRQQDESHLWPIRGRFNATERAIRRIRRESDGCLAMEGLEYALTLDSVISEIVNAAV